MTEDPNTGADPQKVEELQKEVERLSREKAEAEAQAASDAHAAAAAADEKAATEMRMKQELESQKVEADAKMQTELESQRLAAEKAERKRKEDQMRSKRRKGKIIGGIVLLIILVLIILVCTSSISGYMVTESTTSYPYATSYEVWFPINEAVVIGGQTMMAQVVGDEMMFSIGPRTTKLVRGEPVAIGDFTVTLSTLLGRVPLMTVNGNVDLEYQGTTEKNQAYFKMHIESDKSIPEFVVQFMLLFTNVTAQPAAS